MGLPPSGPRVQELLVVSTEDFDLTIKGPAKNNVVEAFRLHQEVKERSILASFKISSKYLKAQVFNPEKLGGLIEYTEGKIFPCFFEQTNYELIIEKRDGCPKKIEIDHINRHLKEAVTPTGRKEKVLSGIINFKDEVGFSRFEIIGDGELLLFFEIEVFPSKIDYQKDFWLLIQEINDEVYNLAYDFLMRTNFPASIKREKEPTLAEFFTIFNTLSTSLFKALDSLKERPHYKIVSVSKIVPPDKVKKVDRKTVNWLVNRGHLFEINGGGINLEGVSYTPRRVIDCKKELTYNTYENRFLKWMLMELDKKLKAFGQKYEEIAKKTGDKRVTDKVAVIRQRLRRFSNRGFLKDVGPLERVEYSLVMQMALGYRDVFRFYLMLIKGLQIESDLFNLSLKNMAELYEYWCFLKLNAILRNKYLLERNEMVSIDKKGITVNLKKGKESLLTYIDPRNNEKFTIAYNRRFNNLPTLAQWPDNILKLEKSGSKASYQYIFDAKYRVNVSEEYIQAFGQAGPPEETVNTMHRYRDAIITGTGCKDDYKRDVFGAYVLFPHNNELAFAGRKEGPPSKFYSSVQEVGIGALPFLPNQTTLVEEVLDELLLEASESAFERIVLHDGTKEHLYGEGARNVLIGSLGRKEQLQVCLDNNMYYTYLTKVQYFLSEIEYIALYQSKEKFKDKKDQGIFYHGKVKSYKILKRKDIKEMPGGKNPNELVVKFQIFDWITKKDKIEPAGYGPVGPQRTTWRLFEEARIYPELHLTSVEVRLWRELRRVNDCSIVNFPRKGINSLDRVDLIEFPGLIVEGQGQNVFKVKTERGERIYDFGSLNKKPGKILREIISFWRGSATN